MSRFNRLIFLIIIIGGFKPFGYSQNSVDYQAKLEKIVPVSPTAASISQYGNIPVNYFTGSASISIPLFTAQSGQLSVPVSLNYQSNGLKVEEIPSWVGLGWSLSAGGVISRSVRGIADEGANGYMNLSIPMKVKFIIDSMSNPTYENDIKYYLTQAGLGLYDLEPDIFHFSLPGVSGKFYYDQEKERFFTMPAQNIQITYGENEFLLVTGDGTKYHFPIIELTSANAPNCSGSPSQAGNSIVTSSWYLSKIENSNQTDSITFEYVDTYYEFENISTSSKYRLIQLVGDVAPGATPPEYPDQLCWQSTDISGKRLSYIRFRNGYLKFTTYDAERSDLPGDKALKKVELFNSDDVLIKRQLLEHDYFGSGLANQMRLKLTSVKEVSADSSIILPHTFIYEEGTFPSRLSYAQDHWGYYNGASGNTSLIPPLLWKDYSGFAHYESGDNRLPNLQSTKLGVLNRIVYPSGGATEFEYENNEVKDSIIQPQYTLHSEHIEGDHNGGIQTIYIDTFVIDEPSNYYNFFNPDGGAFVDFAYTEIGCSFPSGASTCAILTVEGISSGTVSYGPFTTSPMIGNYLPNGTYILKATFDQNPPLYEDFYFSATWKQPVLSNSNPVGGLRIKKIIDYDSIKTENKIIREFSYASDTDSLSSGKIYGFPTSYTTDFSNTFYSAYQAFGTCYYYTLLRNYVKITSTGNYPLVSHQGNYVGYDQVNVFYGNDGNNGKSVYNYQNYPDLIGGFPVIHTSREWARGLLLKEDAYKKTPSSYTLLTTDTSLYTNLIFYDTSLINITYGLKAGFKQSVAYQSVDCSDPLFWYQAEALAKIPIVEEYETLTGNTIRSGNNFTKHEDGGSLSTISRFDYNGKNYLQREVISVNSKGDTIINRTKYNIDYTTISGNPPWLDNLSDLELSVAPIEKLMLKKSPGGSEYVIAGSITQYKTDKPLPDKVFILETNTPIPIGSFTISSIDGSGNFIKDSRYKERVAIEGYDANDNIRSQKKADDVIASYIWDYSSVYPIAECINADSASIAYTSFEADGKGGWSFTGTTNGTTSITGEKSYLMSGGTITKSGLTSTTYIVSYWGEGSVLVNGNGPIRIGKSIGDWTYYEHELTTTSITISGSEYIDELRLYPKAAQMKTYTYKPLIGVTTECDVTNRILYYEYDSFNRLKLIRDQDGKVMRRMDYKYKANGE